jgi:chorismate mutase/prephenate dehydratase
MDALEQARAEIDAVDAQLAALFERRMAAVLQVAEYKRAHGLPVYGAGKGCGPHSGPGPAALL